MTTTELADLITALEALADKWEADGLKTIEADEALQSYAYGTNELEDKIIAMYARGMNQRDIEVQLVELYGI